MRTEQITNQSVWGTDFAAAERRAAIKRVPRMKKRSERDLAPGVSARGVWGTDVSAMDARSVKAYLAGRGDLRSWWWNVSAAVLSFVKKQPLENTMFDFHRAHHAVTLFGMEFKQEVFRKALSFHDRWNARAIARR